MGMFLSLSAVIGKTEAEVCDCLGRYAKSMGGVFHPEEFHEHATDVCTVAATNGNVLIGWPGNFYGCEDGSEFISKELNTTVFYCHIHDSDLWMYVMYNNGVLVDQFNPIPDYWDDTLATHEIEEWAGNAATIVSYVPGLSTADIDKYLVRWDLDEDSGPAYEDDECGQEEFQLFDFLKKLGVVVTIGIHGTVDGATFRFEVKKTI